MTELQKTEFEMLKEFVRICDELDLKYYLVCGSALGAVKYGGFIPWDDDIDVGMPREDYEIFCEKAQAMLPEHLFLQNSNTDKYYHLAFSKIRNNNTTFVEKSCANLNINHGVYIDVFPLDGYPRDARSQIRLEREKYRYSLARLCCLNVPLTWKTKILVFIEKLFGIHRNPKRFVRRIDREIRKYSTSDSDILCNHGNWQGKLEYAPKEQYGDGTIAEFEGLTVRIPEKYDEYLTQKYGDWRADLPKEKQQGHHYHYVCDIEHAYNEYILMSSKHRVVFKNKRNSDDFLTVEQATVMK